jgi:hypothetical protein
MKPKRVTEVQRLQAELDAANKLIEEMKYKLNLLELFLIEDRIGQDTTPEY